MADFSSSCCQYPIEVVVPSSSSSFFDASLSSMDFSDNVSTEQCRRNQNRRRGMRPNNINKTKSISPVRCAKGVPRRSLSLLEDYEMKRTRSCRWQADPHRPAPQRSHSQSLLELSKARWHGVEAGKALAKTLSVPRRKHSHPNLMDLMDEVEKEVNEMVCEYESDNNATPQEDNSSYIPRRHSEPLPEILRRTLSQVENFELNELDTPPPPPPRRASLSPRLPRRSPELEIEVSAQGPRLPRRSLSSNRSLLEDYDDNEQEQQERTPRASDTSKGIDLSCKSCLTDDTIIPGVTRFDRQVSQETCNTLPPALPWRKESIMDLDFDFSSLSRQPSRTSTTSSHAA